jgi:hypothetical protein
VSAGSQWSQEYADRLANALRTWRVYPVVGDQESPLFAFVQRRMWFDEYLALARSGLAQLPSEVYTCACCGYPTLEPSETVAVCFLCCWKDNGQDDPHADEYWRGAYYGLTLSAAREHFAAHLTCFGEGSRYPLFEYEQEPVLLRAKRECVAVFERMVRGDTAVPLWEKVNGQKAMIERIRRSLRR